MAGDTPRDAVVNFVDPLQDSILCVAQAYVNVRGGYHVRPEPHTLTLNDAEAVSLRGRRDLSLWISHDYSIVESTDPDLGPWKVSSGGYIYLVSDADEPVFAYHWHPRPNWDIQFPHVHIYLLNRLGEGPLSKAHFPTGRASLESVIRLLIREFGVEPLRGDYEDVLTRREEAFLRYRQWG